MFFGSPWFVAQAISSIRHGMGSRFAFELARRGERRSGRRRRGIRQTRPFTMAGTENAL